MDLGKDVVVVGNVPKDLIAGDRSVIVGSTDINRNTIINQTAAIGFEAKAGPQSISIGTRASAGLNTNEEDLKQNEGVIKKIDFAERFVRFFHSLLNFLKALIT